SLAFTPDGKRLACGHRDGLPVIVWDAATGKELLSLRGHPEAVRYVAFSSDGKYIVTGGTDGVLKVWEGVTGQEILALKGHKRAITSVVFSPDRRRIVSGSLDGAVKVWDAASGRETLSLESPLAATPRAGFPNQARQASTTVGFSEDEKRLL